MGEIGEKQQKTAVHGRPAGMHGRPPVAEATHGHHAWPGARPCVVARPCIGPVSR